VGSVAVVWAALVPESGEAGLLLQGRDLAGVLSAFRSAPGLFELAAVLLGPLGHHALSPSRQPALLDPQFDDVFTTASCPLYSA
jgi:hypothetical protein